MPRSRLGDVMEERDLTTEELDSLRVWKAQLGVTRDEYWKEYGGVVANDWAEVWYAPGKLTITHAMYSFLRLEQGRRGVKQSFGDVPEGKLKVTCSLSMARFTRDTGRQWWHYSLINGDEIVLQPVPILYQRGVADIAIPREVYRWAIRRFSDNRAPLWIEQGFASVLSDESRVLQSQLTEFPNDPVLMSIDDAEEAIRRDEGKRERRMGIYNGYMTTRAIVDAHGAAPVAALIRSLGDGRSIDEASRAHLGEPWNDVVANAMKWQEGWSR